jgi:hypothetical protein
VGIERRGTRGVWLFCDMFGLSVNGRIVNSRPERVGMWTPVDDEGLETRVRRDKGCNI